MSSYRKFRFSTGRPKSTNAHSGTGTRSTWEVTISKMQACKIISGSAAWTIGTCCLARSRLLQQVGLAGPEAEAPADELRTDMLEHPDIVDQVAPAVQQALHRDRPGEVVLQHLARHGPVELIVAGPRDRLRGLRSRKGPVLLGEGPAAQGPLRQPPAGTAKRRRRERESEGIVGPLSLVSNKAGVFPAGKILADTRERRSARGFKTVEVAR